MIFVVENSDLEKAAKALYDRPVAGYIFGIVYLDGMTSVSICGDAVKNAQMIPHLNECIESAFEKSMEGLNNDNEEAR